MIKYIHWHPIHLQVEHIWPIIVVSHSPDVQNVLNHNDYDDEQEFGSGQLFQTEHCLNHFIDFL